MDKAQVTCNVEYLQGLTAALAAVGAPLYIVQTWKPPTSSHTFWYYTHARPDIEKAFQAGRVSLMLKTLAKERKPT
jgi:hypothetical protein